MRLLASLALLFCILLPNRAAADVCSGLVDRHWTPLEGWTWTQLCMGQPADMNNFPANLVNELKTNQLSAAFILTVLTEPSHRAALAGRPIYISNAYVIGKLAIEEDEIPNSISFTDVSFEQDLSFKDARIDGSLLLNNVTIDGDLDLSGALMRILDIQGLSANDVVLTNAEITHGAVIIVNLIKNVLGEGSLYFDSLTVDSGGLHVSPPHNAQNLYENLYGNSMSITGTLQLDGFRTKSAVKLIGSNIYGNAIFDDDVFGGNFDLSLSQVSGNIQSNNTEINGNGNLVISDAKIGGYLVFSGLKFPPPICPKISCYSSILLIHSTVGFSTLIKVSGGPALFDGDEIHVGKSLFLDFTGSPTIEILLDEAEVDGDLGVSGPVGDNFFLRGTRISGTLRFNDGFGITSSFSDLSADLFEPPVKWAEGGTFDLSDGSVESIDNPDWIWPKHVNLENAHFAELEANNVHYGDQPCNRDIFGNWLVNTNSYSPQPYDEVAKALRNSGDSEDADCVMEMSARLATVGEPNIVKLRDELYGLVAGYGYDSERSFVSAAVSVAVLVMVGMFVLFSTGEGRRNHLPVGLFYSLSALIPFVTLDKRFDEEVRLCGIARWYFYLHKIFGYIIASFILATVSSVLPKL